jgi:hypothetical protein
MGNFQVYSRFCSLVPVEAVAILDYVDVLCASLKDQVLPFAWFPIVASINLANKMNS